MTPELAACVLEGSLLLHEELSVDPDAPCYVGTPDQNQVLHDELWLIAGEQVISKSAALVEAWCRPLSLAARAVLRRTCQRRHQHAA
jgi:hypothetical protein